MDDVDPRRPLGDDVYDGWATAPYRQSDYVPSVGELIIEDVAIKPDLVAPGGQVTVTVTVAETAEFVSPFNPNTCDPPEYATMEGIQGKVTVDPDWTTASSQTKCIAMWKQATGREDYVFSFTAPEIEQGDSTVREIHTYIELPGSNEGPDGRFDLIDIDVGGEYGCTTTEDCEPGEVCENGDCIPESAGCNSDDDCLPGHRCEAGSCVLDTPESPVDFGGIVGTARAGLLVILGYLVVSKGMDVYESTQTPGDGPAE